MTAPTDAKRATYPWMCRECRTLVRARRRPRACNTCGSQDVDAQYVVEKCIAEYGAGRAAAWKEAIKAAKKAKASLLYIAAECHRAKWAFESPIDIEAFRALDRIGMEAKEKCDQIVLTPPAAGKDGSDAKN
jgi:hypothetical protein